MTDGSIKIDTSAESRPATKGRGCGFWILAFVLLCLFANIYALFPAFMRHNASRKPIEPPADRPRMKLHEKDIEPVDDSQLQWISPTSGPPISLEYVPLGTQAILHLRPAELAFHPEGEKLRGVLGLWGEQSVGQIERLTGARIDEIESLLVSLHRVADRWDCTLRADFAEPRGGDRPTVAGRETFLPAEEQGRVLISCPQAVAAELRGQGSQPPVVARDLERLLPLTDQNRSLTLLMPAKFLDIEGRELFVDGGERIIAAFNMLVPENASALLVSLDWREHFYGELAATIVQNAPAHRFNTKLVDQLRAAEAALASSLKSMPPHSYGKAVEERFPAMLHTMSDYTRVSRAGDIAIARCYLPVQAGHNLILAARLRLSDAVPAAEATRPALTVAERLRKVTTLAFPKETLENALEMLADDVKLPIRIAGRDLQLEGITKNQTFAIELRDRPVDEILVEVLCKANPDREATGPVDPRQKLVYVIRENAVVVTTRSAAAQRGEELPKVFGANSP